MEQVPLHLSPSCRILTISSSLPQAVSFVQQIQSLSPGDTKPTEKIGEDSVPEQESSSSSVQEKSIPWIISNKYYSADVHFFAREIKGLAPYLLKNVPAVLFIWRKGDAYKHHIQRLSQDLQGVEPEVSLAVRLPNSMNGGLDSGKRSQQSEEEKEEEEFEDSGAIDEFLSSRGFEFVDVPLASDNEATEHDFDGIPSLPRVVDALSTIMWPSMQAASRKKRNTGPSKGIQQEDALLDWANASFDSSDPFPSQDDLVVPASRSSGLAAQARRQKEMDELARWLQEDDGVDTKANDDPWQSREAKHMTSSPVEEKSFEAPPAKDKEGFDDDFTIFVSAPAQPSSSSSKLDSAHDQWLQEEHSFDSVETAFSSDKLGLPHDSVMYHSLGSASDLSETLGRGSERWNDPEEEDEGLPTQDEIRQSAQRIFGSESLAEDVDEYEMAPFDLSNMLNALQGMKAEIAGIEDADERRKAAAKVALGLVYGLERESGAGHDGH
ncbi:hypothetical protein D9758_002780 [Tetrapyrgos nigripes]|uniref:Alpha/gamma-adaptin-binding protein p34 n=1 Tax=Tetrapyrgos nigripes TaxID=182062 RepID=A0A8H5LU89_9AGAR|nr:hypothetical protein D9758_002780 [Tetrapyrgos nigripes]